MMQDRRARRQLGRVFRLAWKERTWILWGTVALALSSGTTLAFPKLIGDMVDGALASGDTGAVDQLALLTAVVFAMMGVATGFRAYIFTVTGERVVTRLRQQVYAHVMTQDIAFFDKRRTGELLSRLASDTAVIQNTVSVNVSMLLRNLVGMVGGIVLLMMSSPLLTALMLTVVPFVSIGAVVFGRVIRRVSRDGRGALARAAEVAEERGSAGRCLGEN